MYYSNPKSDIVLVAQAFLPVHTDRNVCATGESATHLGLLYMANKNDVVGINKPQFLNPAIF